MKCPFCGHLETQVVETRMSEDGDSVRRRRQCGACEKRYTTYERPDVSFPNIVKKDGRRIEYQLVHDGDRFWRRRVDHKSRCPLLHPRFHLREVQARLPQ